MTRHIDGDLTLSDAPDTWSCTSPLRRAERMARPPRSWRSRRLKRNKSNSEGKDLPYSIERLDGRISPPLFDALEREKTHAPVLCKLFLGQAADLSHSLD